ncbi:MAG: isoprenylcysteine carboxylmethyltransferase family protein [Gemmatimonadales bacterium]
MPGPGRRFWTALTAFLALPGVVAFLVPWLLRPPGEPLRADGLGLVAIGAVLLAWCIRDFYVTGMGSLAPWAPPERLVTVGLYRVSRNPMYLAVLAILAGWAVACRSRGLAGYALAVGLAFHLRVVLGEEPWLAARHGEDWVRYRTRVPRWLGISRGG